MQRKWSWWIRKRNLDKLGIKRSAKYEEEKQEKHAEKKSKFRGKEFLRLNRKRINKIKRKLEIKKKRIF